MVAYATRRYSAPNLEFTCGDVLSLGDERVFDLTYSIDVIHHFHEYLAEFRRIRKVLGGAGAWLAIEPNIWHPYVTLQQERMRRAGYDEDHLRPWAVEPLFRQANLRIRSRTYLHLLPGGMRKVAPWLQKVERSLERARLLGGSVVYTLDPA